MTSISSARACGLVSFSVMTSPFRRACALPRRVRSGTHLSNFLHILCRPLHRDPEGGRLPAALVVDEAETPAQVWGEAPELLHPDQNWRAGMAREPRLDLLRRGQPLGEPAQLEVDDPE